MIRTLLNQPLYTMALTDPRELLLHELKDLLFAERKFLTGTRHMIRETNDPTVRGRLEQHLTETEAQIGRLEEAFGLLGEEAKGEQCDGAIGLREEHDHFKEKEDPSPVIMEAFDLGAGLRVEYYEIAAYTTAIAMADALGEADVARLLQESLAEEEAMVAFLTENGPKALRKLFASAGSES